MSAKKAAPVVDAKVSSSKDRHDWLEAATAWCSRALVKGGYEVPATVRVSVGFTGARIGMKAIGACWYPEASTDGHHEIFIGPHIKDPVEIVGVILHELVHVVAGKDAKHGKAFKDIAVAVGLTGKMTATTPGDDLRAIIETKFLVTHPYPSGSLDIYAQRPKQTTRLVKCDCETCGYTVRTTAKWLNVTPPVCPDLDCPDHGQPMKVHV